MEIEAPSQVKPGEKITLRIKAVPKSYLGLLAVDSRVFHNEDNNDFSESYFDTMKSALRSTSLDKQTNKTLKALNIGLITMTNAENVSNVKISKFYYVWFYSKIL